MEENLGKDIIIEMISEIDEQKRKKILKKISEDYNLDALDVGFDYNEDKVEGIPQCKLDVVFGKGYLLAIKHIQKYIDETL